MQTALIVLHVIICLLLIVCVILQKGKGAEMGAAFGVGSSSAVFGPKGPTPFLAKVTVFLGVLFFVNSIALTLLMGKPRYVNAMTDLPKQVKEHKPAKMPLPPKHPPVHQRLKMKTSVVGGNATSAGEKSKNATEPAK